MACSLTTHTWATSLAQTNCPRTHSLANEPTPGQSLESGARRARRPPRAWATQPALPGPSERLTPQRRAHRPSPRPHAMAAAGAGASAPADDSTVIWAFDRLLDCDGLPDEVLGALLPAAAPSVEELPDVTRARLFLRSLHTDLRAGRVDEQTVESLRQLAACDVPQYVADPLLVRPSPQLLLTVRRRAGGRAGGAGRGRSFAFPGHAAARWPRCVLVVWLPPAASWFQCLAATHQLSSPPSPSPLQAKTEAALSVLRPGHGLAPEQQERVLQAVFSGQCTHEEYHRRVPWPGAVWLSVCVVRGRPLSTARRARISWRPIPFFHFPPAGTKSCWRRWATPASRPRCRRSTRSRRAACAGRRAGWCRGCSAGCCVQQARPQPVHMCLLLPAALAAPRPVQAALAQLLEFVGTARRALPSILLVRGAPPCWWCSIALHCAVYTVCMPPPARTMRPCHPGERAPGAALRSPTACRPSRRMWWRGGT